MTCAGYPVENYGLYVLNALEEPEAGEIREHLAERCATCHREVRTSLDLWYLTALAEATASENDPSRRLRSRVLAIADRGSGERRQWAAAWVWGPALAAAAVILVVVWTGNRPAQNGDTAQELARQRAAVESLQRSERQWQDRAQDAERRLQAAQPATPPAGAAPAAPPRAPTAPAPGVRPETAAELARAQAEVQTLTDTLARERAQAAAVATELNNQRTQLATLQQQRDDAEKRAAGAADERSRRVDLETQMATLSARVQQLTRENATYRETVSSLTRQLDRNTRLVAFLGSESLRMIRLRSTESGGRANGQAFIVDGQRVVFYATGLPALPPGRSYQLWLLRGKSPAIVSGGVFRPTGGERTSLEFGDAALIRDINGLAVTDEPEGGSPGPTGRKFLVGTPKS